MSKAITFHGYSFSIFHTLDSFSSAQNRSLILLITVEKLNNLIEFHYNICQKGLQEREKAFVSLEGTHFGPTYKLKMEVIFFT